MTLYKNRTAVFMIRSVLENGVNATEIQNKHQSIPTRDIIRFYIWNILDTYVVYVSSRKFCNLQGWDSTWIVKRSVIYIE